MKRKRLFKLVLLLAVPMVLWGIVAERHSWRPKTIELAGAHIEGLTFSPDGKFLFADNKIQQFSEELLVIDLKNKEVVKETKNLGSPMFLGNGEHIALLYCALAFSPDNTMLAVGGHSSLQLWRVK